MVEPLTNRAVSPNTCLTAGHTHAHQPLLFSLPNGYQWGIEQDGLVPTTSNVVPGLYAQGAARLGGLELSWGMNGGGSASCGQTLSATGTPTAANCNIANTQTSTCGTGPGGTSVMCYQALEDMLDSGLYPVSGSTPTGQLYVLVAADLCNSYLWLGLAVSNQAITGLTRTTTDLGTISGLATEFKTCHGSAGTFSSGGSYSSSGP